MKNKKGISLLELSVALAVVLLLSVVVMRSGAVRLNNAQLRQDDASFQAVAQACRLYQAKFGRWPVFVHDLIDADFINTSMLNRFQLSFVRRGQVLVIVNGKVGVATAMPSMGLARIDYVKNNENNKFKSASILTY